MQLFLLPKQIYLWKLLIFDKIYARFIPPFSIVASQKSFKRPIRFVCYKVSPNMDTFIVIDLPLTTHVFEWEPKPQIK